MHTGQPTPPHAAAIRCGAAASTAAQIDEAIRAAVSAAAAQVGGTADVAVAFVSARYGDAIRPALEGLGDAIGAAVVIAATAEAVLADGVEYETEPAVTVWMARMAGATIIPFSLEYAQTPDGGMFAGWPPDLDGPWPDEAAVVLLADPFSFPVDAFIKRMEEDHPGVPIVGGMASGGFQPGMNTLAVGSRTYDSGAVGFVVGGGARVRPVVSQGCRPIGRPMIVTKSEENVIIELGGKPALERLKEIYGDLAPADRELVRTSLHVGRVATEYKDSFQRGDFLVRNVVGADSESGVIAVGDLVRTGQTVQFHVRDAASADEDLRTLLSREKDRGARPAGALVFTCNGRGTRLFDEASHDARCVREIIGQVPTAGFFAQGEIGPIGRRNCLHGFTASIALFEPRG
jgi:small ligand-binding sensory domain FIST